MLFKKLQNNFQVKTGPDIFYNEKPLLESGYKWISEISKKWWNNIARKSYCYKNAVLKYHQTGQ